MSYRAILRYKEQRTRLRKHIMNCRSAIFLAATLFFQTVSLSQQPALKFVKEIGVGWQTDKWGWMSFVAFNPDGTIVASDGATAPGDVSGNLSLWSFPGGQLMKQLPTRPVAISGDWKYYASVHGVGEMETGKSLISAPDNVYPLFAFSADSRYVAESLPGGGIHKTHIRVVDLASGKQVSAFGRHDLFSIAISPDGTTLASGHWDLITLWNMFTGKRVAVLRGFGRYVYGLSFSRDGRLLAAGTDVGKVEIWDVDRRAKLHSLDPAGAYDYVSKPAFSPDGRLVAVGIYGTGTVFLIDVNSGKVLDRKKVSDLGCGSVAFSPDGRYLITPSTGGLITWPYDRGGTIRVFQVNVP
jgi:WD40 repeat protein